MNEKYFTERVFWLPDTNTLLHVCFMHGHGWYASVESPYGYGWYNLNHFATTYAGLMSNYSHRNPELLLQEEW